VRIAEPDEVKDERVEHLVRKCVLFVQQDAYEERGGAYPRARMSGWNGDEEKEFSVPE
jgi:hypothetical protein